MAQIQIPEQEKVKDDDSWFGSENNYKVESEEECENNIFPTFNQNDNINFENSEHLDKKFHFDSALSSIKFKNSSSEQKSSESDKKSNTLNSE